MIYGLVDYSLVENFVLVAVAVEHYWILVDWPKNRQKKLLEKVNEIDHEINQRKL